MRQYEFAFESGHDENRRTWHYVVKAHDAADAIAIAKELNPDGRIFAIFSVVDGFAQCRTLIP